MDYDDDPFGYAAASACEEEMRLRMRLLECETEISNLKATIERQRGMLQVLQSTVLQQSENVSGSTEDMDCPPLVLAAREGNPEMVLAVLSGGGTGGQVVVDTALQVACQYGHIDVASLLLDKAGADVRGDHDSALMWACHIGSQELVALLLERGACAHALHDLPIRIAVHKGHLEVVKALTKK